MAQGRRARILVVDDQEAMTQVLAEQLVDDGYAVDTATDGRTALELAAKRIPDVVVTDLRMEGLDGLDVLEGIHALDPAVPVLVLTAFGGVESAVEAMKRGAYHYLVKPYRVDELRLQLTRALVERQLVDENRVLRRESLDRARLEGIVGQGSAMRSLFGRIQQIAQSSSPVLIRGQSGTGKELAARALHALGPRRDRPFVAVNCTALPEALLESELFGHVRGAFTGAVAHRRGLFVEADGGTLLLDEIGDMPPSLQAKILRVIERGEVRNVGSDASRQVDVRIVASTHQPLEDRIREGSFRADLFYRLNVLQVSLPPLSERREDIPALVEHFLAKARERNAWAKGKRLLPDALEILVRLDWPGNVRQLENTIEQLVVLSTREDLGAADLAACAPELMPSDEPFDRARATRPTLRVLEEEYIAYIIRKCDGNLTRAAEILGVDRSTLHRRGHSAAGREPRAEPAEGAGPAAGEVA